MYQLYALALTLFILILNPASLIHKFKLRKIPTVGHGLIDMMFLPSGTQKKLHDAFKKFKTKLYRFQALEGDVVVVPLKYYDEMKAFPDSHLDFTGAQEISLMSKYTKTPITDLLLTSLRKNVGPQASKFVPELYKGAQRALATDFPVTKEWKPYIFFPKVPHLIAFTGGSLLTGAELGHDEAWLDATIGWLVSLFQASGILLFCPSFLRPLFQYFIPDIYYMKTYMKKTHELAIPVIQKRLEDMEKDGFERPNDLIQWALDLSRERGKVDLEEQVHCQLMAALGSVHTTSMAFTQAIFDLAARPEYAEPLREEIMEVLGTGHDVTKASLAKLKKMDSFIRESGRLNGSMLVTSRRIAKRDIVLSNGELIPAGTQTSLPVHDQLNDVPSPDVFDGFRWYNLRKEKAENENKYQFSESGRNSLYWGSGKHACYGRFFASDMIKCLLVIILRDYDIGLPEGKGRPESWKLDWKVVPNISAEVLMRERKV